ncbi:MAG: hypothetical protein INR73_17190 [Williamsia sp.]|nr:hypothetical protein [Williamsia sp.]
MQINRYNYEEYFLLYTDGELSMQERAAVEEFAAGNPDLQEELIQLQQYKMVPEKIVFPGKENLLKQEVEPFIHTANYEEYFLLYADGELGTQEKAGVERFVSGHPALQPEFELINKTVLTPDRSISFPDKEQLYRYENRKVVRFAWWRLAAAAVVLIGVALWWNGYHITDTAPQVAGELPGHEIRPLHPENVVSQSPNHTTPLITPDLPSTGEPESSIAMNLPQSGQATETQEDKGLEKETEKTYRPLSPRKSPVRQIPSETVALHTIDPAIASAREPIIDKPAFINEHTGAEMEDESNRGHVSFASNDEPEDVYITNVPLDKKIPLRGLFRKASRLINKATGSNGGEKTILIGNVEVALK